MQEWASIFNRLDGLRLRPGTKSRVVLSGRVVSEKQIQRARRHWKSSRVSEKHNASNIGGENSESTDAYIELSSPDGTWHRLTDSTRPISNVLTPVSESETAKSRTPLPADSSESAQVQQDAHPNILNRCPTVRPDTSDTSSSTLENLTLPTFLHEDILRSPPLQSYSQRLRSPISSEGDLSSPTIRSRQHTTPLLSDNGTNFIDYSREATYFTSSIPVTPFKWLGQLSYLIFEDALASQGAIREIFLELDRIDFSLPSHRIIGLLLDDIEMIDTSSSGQEHHTGMNWQSALDAFCNFLPGDANETRGGTGDYLFATNKMTHSNLTQSLIFSMTNGLAGLQNFPMEGIVKFLARSRSLNGLFIQVLKANGSFNAKALAETLFRVAIEAKEGSALPQLLTTGLIDVNRTGHFVTDGRNCTAIEYAAMYQNLDIVELLLKANANLNETFFEFFAAKEVVRIISRQWLHVWDLYWQRQPKFIKIRWHETAAFKSAKWTADAIELCLSIILPVEHYCLFEIRFLEQIPPVFDDPRATNAMRNILQACRRTDCNECLTRYSMNVGRAAAVGAWHKHISFVTLLLPSCDDIWVNVILSLSIIYRQKDLTENALAHVKTFKFFIDKSTILEEVKGTQLVEEMLRTPLAAAILIGDKLLVHRLETAGALNCVEHKKGYAFQDILAATVQVKDVDYMRKLLARCPSPPIEATNYASSLAIRARDYQIAIELIRAGSNRSLADYKVDLLDRATKAGKFDMILIQPSDYLDLAAEIGSLAYVKKHLNHYLPEDATGLESALRLAIENHHEEIAIELLNAGADVNNELPKKILTQVIIQRNARLVRMILNSDIGLHGWDIGTFKEALVWGDKSIIEDLVETFLINTKRSDELKAVPILDLSEIEDFDVIKSLISHWKMTADQLSRCLWAAVAQNNHAKAQFFLEQATNASRREFLESATEGYPTLLYTHLQWNKDISILPFGARVLRAAIEEGLESPQTLDFLLQPGMVDLEGNCASQDRINPKYISPLGTAIQQCGKGKDPKFSIIAKLLGAGCNVNKIALSETIKANGSIIAYTPLLLAITSRDKKLVQFLIDHGADVHADASLAVKRTPLQQAAELGSLEIVKHLLSYGVDVNAAPSTRSGGTALQFAASSGNCNIAAELLSRGALLYATPSNVNGRWPIEGAAECGRLTMIEYLWMAKQNTLFPSNVETGFEERHCQKAMRRAEENGHIACRDFIAELAGLNGLRT